jgi:hypothetical protein
MAHLCPCFETLLPPPPRNIPFSFSPEARELLGSPNHINEDVLAAFPSSLDPLIASTRTFWLPSPGMVKLDPLGIFRPGGLSFFDTSHGKVKDLDGLHAFSRYYGQDNLLRCFSETEQHFALKKKINRIFYLHYKQNFSKTFHGLKDFVCFVGFKKVDSWANQNSFYKRE